MSLLEGINLFLLIIIIVILFLFMMIGFRIYTLYLSLLDTFNKDKAIVKLELENIKSALEIKIPQIQAQIAELEKELQLIIKILNHH